jgi:prevent-host-death family protein
MDARTTLSISQARKNIFKIAERVQRPAVCYTLTEKGRPKAVVISADEFESWQETLEVMRIFPGLKEDIEKAEGEYKKSHYLTIEEVLSKEGFVLSKKIRG